MFVTTTCSAGSATNVPSLSSASTTNQSPSSHTAPLPISFNSPPMMKEGLSPASTSTSANLDEVGDAVGGIEMGVGAHRRRHGVAAGGIFENGRQLHFESIGGELVVGNHDSRACIGEEPAVGGLVVAGGDGQRHENGGNTDGGELCNPATGAGDSDVRRRQEHAHPVLVLDDLVLEPV